MVKNDRTGEVIQTKYGKAKIVQYNSATDITVLFDGYGIKQHVNYRDLVKDQVLPPGAKKKVRVASRKKNDHTGEVVQTKYGSAKIIQYKSTRDVTVLFDGYGIKEHVHYDNLVKNQVLPPGAKIKVRADAHTRKDHAGEVVQTKYGQAKIIQYKSHQDITVLFDDYGIKEHVIYNNLVNDNVLPSGAKKKVNDHIHQVRRTYEQSMLGKTFHTTRCGNCTVVKYKNSQNVTVKFEDGTLVETQTSSLKRGQVHNPNHMRSKYIGAKSTTNNGIPFTITDVMNIKTDTDNHTQCITTVEFIDGSQKAIKTSPAEVMKGGISHPSFKGFEKIRQNPYERTWRNSHAFLDRLLIGQKAALRAADR